MLSAMLTNASSAVFWWCWLSYESIGQRPRRKVDTSKFPTQLLEPLLEVIMLLILMTWPPEHVGCSRLVRSFNVHKQMEHSLDA